MPQQDLRSSLVFKIARLDESIAEVDLLLRVSNSPQIRNHHLPVLLNYLSEERNRLLLLLENK